MATGVSPLISAATTGVASGLSSSEAQARLATIGPNELHRERATPPLTIFARQFGSPVVWLLLVASVISASLGETLDAVAIGAIVVLNAVIGFLQEHRAEGAVLALRSMTAPRARVIRDGRSIVVPALTIVPGDLLVLEAGDIVAADARLQVAHARSTNEASLTGESTPADKLVAFGGTPDDGQQGAWTTVPMRQVVQFLQQHLRDHWEVLRHAQVRDPAIAVLALMERFGVGKHSER